MAMLVQPPAVDFPELRRVGTAIHYYRWCSPGEALKAKRGQGDTELTVNGRTVPARMTAQVLRIRHGRVYLLVTHHTPVILPGLP